ncbi:hypothetical protein JXJ21_24080 [candidate division KSB1 bacterium]|nr:hypothetical protein [candidate division KSB1 bacterium]
MLFNGGKIFSTRTPRGFKYKPRYQQEDSEDASRRNIRFRRIEHRTKTNKRALLYLVILTVIVVYLLIYFNRMAKTSDGNIKVESIKVEEIQE